jgi:hypothetical protein
MLTIRRLVTPPTDVPNEGWRHSIPVVFLELPVVILFALYPGLFSLSQLAR